GTLGPPIRVLPPGCPCSYNNHVVLDGALLALVLAPSPWLFLALKPQCRGTAAVVEGRVGSVVLDIRLPGAGDTYGVKVHVVLLLRNMPLDVEDDLPARLQILRAPLFLEHGRDRGIVDVTAVAPLVRRIQSIQHTIRLPGNTEGTEGQPLELAGKRRRHIGAVLLGF